MNLDFRRYRIDDLRMLSTSAPADDRRPGRCLSVEFSTSRSRELSIILLQLVGLPSAWPIDTDRPRHSLNHYISAVRAHSGRNEI